MGRGGFTVAMSRQHYVAVAALIDAERKGIDQEMTGWKSQEEMLRRLAYSMAEEFKRDNPRFNLHKFVKACGFTASGGNYVA